MSRFDTIASISRLAIGGHHDQQRLRRRDNAPDGVDGQLLHHAVNRRSQGLEFGPLLGLDQVFTEARDLAFGLHQVAR